MHRPDPPRPIPRTGDWRDARPASDTEVQAAGARDVPAWRLVWVRRAAGWRPGLLTAWRRVPAGYWAAYVIWGPGEGERGWLKYKGAAIVPAACPDDTLGTGTRTGVAR
ncbi:hypothetical protein ACFVFS_37770 [Kitasatospora sp. NPDC057692]|uniref:hypothetical protein n=1 Tax=Kitasatospora sp. NPDC057692 TaxID=3346215 RepID=UPI00369E9393